MSVKLRGPSFFALAALLLAAVLFASLGMVLFEAISGRQCCDLAHQVSAYFFPFGLLPRASAGSPFVLLLLGAALIGGALVWSAWSGRARVVVLIYLAASLLVALSIHLIFAGMVYSLVG